MYSQTTPHRCVFKAGNAKASRRRWPGLTRVHHTKNRHREFPPEIQDLNATVTNPRFAAASRRSLPALVPGEKKPGDTQFRETTEGQTDQNRVTGEARIAKRRLLDAFREVTKGA